MTERGKLILVTGGARSGKSAFAERLAQSIGGQVTYVATATAGDAEMEERIAAHRCRRPPGWETVEEQDRVIEVIDALGGESRVILLDCLTVLVSNWLLQTGQDGNEDLSQVDLSQERCHELMDRSEMLARQARECVADVIMVTNEVGWGVVPPSPLGRTYRDLAGKVNQIVAGYADEVYLTVAGLQMKLK